MVNQEDIEYLKANKALIDNEDIKLLSILGINLEDHQ